MNKCRLLGMAALAFLAVAVVQAAPDPCKGKPPHPEYCSDGGGDGTMTLVNVMARWGGLINEAAPRRCDNTYGSAGNGGVNYECAKDPEVYIRPLGYAGAGLCSLLEDEDGWVLDGANKEPMNTSRITAYEFMMDPTWNDTPCVENADCLVRMSLWAYFEKWCDAANRKCGRLVIFDGWGNAAWAEDGDLNPFTEHQEITIEDLTVTFKDIGKNRTVATCSYEDPGIYFTTDPIVAAAVP